MAFILARRSQNAQRSALTVMTPRGTPTPAPMAVSREEDEDEDFGVSVAAQEVLDGFVEETANPATPGIAVP